MIHKRPSTNKGKVIVIFEIPGAIRAERINLSVAGTEFIVVDHQIEMLDEAINGHR